MDDQNTQTNNLPPTTNKQTNKFKRIHVSKGLLFFLLGIITGVIMSYLYVRGAEVAQQQSNETPVGVNQNTVGEIQNNDPSVTGKNQVTEDDLKEYVEAKDCSALSQFNTLEISLSRLTMQKIDLSTAVITAGKENGTNYIRWKTLPVVVDNQCKELKLSDIKSGDMLNIYTKRSASSQANSDYASDTKMIQRIND